MYYQQPITLILEGYGLAPGTTREKGYFQKNWVGVSAARFNSWNPYPISDQNLWFSLPYFRPDKKFHTLFQTWPLNQSARDKMLRHVHGWRKHWKENGLIA